MYAIHPSIQKLVSGWIVLVLVFCGLVVNAAREIKINPAGRNSTTVLRNTSAHLLVSNTLSSFNSQLLNTGNGEFVALLVDSYSKNNTIGAPQLPVLSKLIEIPEGSTPEVKVISYDLKEYKLADWGITQKLLPVQAPQSKNSNRINPVAMDRKLYSTNSFYGEDLAKVEVAGYMRGVHLANLFLSPVEYNPVTNTLRVYDNLVVEINFTRANELKSREDNSGKHSVYFKSIFSNVINYQPAEAKQEVSTGIPEKYVIVSDPMFKSVLKPFINWKTKRGFNVIEAYTDDPLVGTSTISIKAFLQNLYTSATSGDPAPTFVLFVGDVAQVPAFECGDHVSDLYYCEYSGDYLPEVFYGRFSANTLEELLPQINKTLQYEQYLMPDPSYLNEAVLVAGADAMHQLRWGNGQVNYVTVNYINTAHTLVPHTYLQPEPAGSNYSQNIQANISNGVSYANYSAHGNIEGWANPTFTINDISKLQNAGKYGLIVGNCCETNVYNKNTFGEALVRAENKGALGYIGASGLSYWDEDYWWSVGSGSIVTNPTYENTGLGAYDRIFHDHGEARSEWFSTMGQMVFAGNLAVQESNSGMKKYYWETYCLLGDPSTMIYFGVPSVLKAEFNPLLPMKASTLQVNTEPFASVAISKNNILNGVAQADESGLAVVSLKPFSEPGYANMVITMQNREPYTDSVKVESPEGPFLVIKNIKINDSPGNANQLAEPGETLSVSLQLCNVGNSRAAKARSILSSNDKYVFISQDTCYWPAIAGEDSASDEDAFTLQLGSDVPDMHKVSFTVKTQADSGMFNSGFSFLVYAPKLETGTIHFEDSTAGNGNGQFDQGETVLITVPVTNSGHSISGEGTTQMFVFGDFVTSNSPVHNFEKLTPGETDTSAFFFTVSPDTPLGSCLSMYFVATAGSYNSVAGITPVIGSQLEDFETADFLKFNWQFKGEKSWGISSSEKFKNSFAAKSGAIYNLERSEMYFNGQVLLDDTISFYRKVSSENGYDYLTFYIDDYKLAHWSGNQEWGKASFPVSAGIHRFRWVYEKDEATVAGQDAAWIDNIQLPALSQPDTDTIAIKILALPQTICAGEQSQLYAFASGDASAYTYSWTSASTLSQAGIFNPFAYPVETTTYDVSVNRNNLSSTSKVTVDVLPVPDAPVISVSDNELISSELSGNQWYNNYGPIPGATGQKYLPPSSDTYYVITSNSKGCPSVLSNRIAFDITGIKTSVENSFRVYPNPFTSKLFIDYNVKSACRVKIVLYNSLGNEVATIEESEKAAGKHNIFIDAGNIAAGMYLCKISSTDGVQFVKVIKN
jgi:hypothetical protein